MWGTRDELESRSRPGAIGGGLQYPSYWMIPLRNA
jgi:hypothetical protein